MSFLKNGKNIKQTSTVSFKNTRNLRKGVKQKYFGLKLMPWSSINHIFFPSLFIRIRSSLVPLEFRLYHMFCVFAS